MSKRTRAGIRAARTLLSLLEENSAEDFEAAEAILGEEKELTHILQLLRKFQEHEEEPLSVERLREIVRSEILHLPLSTQESALDQALAKIEALNASPGGQVDGFTDLLVKSAAQAGPEHETKVASLLRSLAIQGLTENLVMFPTAHALAQLRSRWAGEPLPYKHQEPRRRIATRLLTDAAQQEGRIDLLRMLLREGLRGPADASITEVRQRNQRRLPRSPAGPGGASVRNAAGPGGASVRNAAGPGKPVLSRGMQPTLSRGMQPTLSRGVQPKKAHGA